MGPVQLRIQNDLGGGLDADQLITTARVDRVMSWLIVQMPVRLIREDVVCGVQGRTRVCFRDAVTAPTAVTSKGGSHDWNEDDAAGGDGVGGDGVTTRAGDCVEGECPESCRDDYGHRPDDPVADAARRQGR